jgi:hypothetical protein
MSLKNVFLILISFILFFTFSFLIAQDKPLTLKEICNESNNIIIGTPVSMNSYKSNDGRHVYTDIDIAVEKSMKGNLTNQDVIKLTMYGGTIDGNTTYVVGFPRFFLKMRSFFFLKEKTASIEKLKGPQRVFVISGIAQGKIDIIEKDGKSILSCPNFPSIQLKENGESILLSKESSVTPDKMISYIKDLLNN